MKKTLRFLAVAAVATASCWLSLPRSAQAGYQQCIYFQGKACTGSYDQRCLDDEALHVCTCFGGHWACGIE
jgi:hypothetical protein